ncbi:ArsR/SmtB family transcription factor [Haloarchaeobius amylolyticus]|uniref:ArsR/SmtB family transcription factor n=1 Tax=Haloarchaeobius amylolyticus TaxID=1198296 RepID=UPI0022710FBE|nr:winged helix-turn-helix domain-containing protein [Haloarchaeobius amylolyticus]
MDNTDPADAVSHGAAFALLGNETRVAILRELWETATEGPMPFSELRERVGMRDSGQFNYHLTKLTGTFIRKVDPEDDEEGEGGYVLRFAGIAVVGAILSGMYQQAGFDEPVPVDGECPRCGGALDLEYEDERANLSCRDCGNFTLQSNIPAGVFSQYDREATPEVFDRWMRAQVDQIAAGFCMLCQGKTTFTVLLGAHTGADWAEEDEALVEYECERCGATLYASVTEMLTRHPAIVSFYHDHGADVRDEPTWGLDWLLDEVAVVTEDPLTVSFDVTVDDETLRLTVDDQLTVVAEERLPAEQARA